VQVDEDVETPEARPVGLGRGLDLGIDAEVSDEVVYLAKAAELIDGGS
jgi:hypothetical protein